MSCGTRGSSRRRAKRRRGEVDQRAGGVVVVADATAIRCASSSSSRPRSCLRAADQRTCRRWSARARASRRRRARGPARRRARRARSPRRGARAASASCDWRAQRHRELAAVREAPRASRSPGRRPPTASSPRPDHQSRRESQRRSSPSRSGSSGVALDQRAARLDRALRAAAQVRLDRDALQRLLVGAHGERRLPLLERLPVPARGGRGAGGGGGVAADRVVVAGAARVVGEPRGIVVAGGLERGEHAPVELAPAGGGDAVLDGAAREVVAERERVAVRSAAARRRCTRRSPSAGSAISHSSVAPGTTRRELDDARAARSASLHARASCVARRERLGDEERVAAGDRVQVARVAAARRRAARPRRATAGRARSARPAATRARAGPRAAAPGGVVRIRQPAREPRARRSATQIERRVVGPVQVLDHAASARSSASSAAASTASREPSASAAASAPPAWRAMSCSGPSGRGVISGSHAPQSAVAARDRPHQRGLADPRLAGDDDDAARRRSPPAAPPARSSRSSSSTSANLRGQTPVGQR